MTKLFIADNDFNIVFTEKGFATERLAAKYLDRRAWDKINEPQSWLPFLIQRKKM